MKKNPRTLLAKLNPKRDGIDFEIFELEKCIKGVLAVNQPPTEYFITEKERDLIGAAALAIVAGYFLPEEIHIQWNSIAAASPEYPALLQMLYDVRAYCAKLPLASPALHISGNDISAYTDNIVLPPAVYPEADCLTLFSGGIDSTAALTILQEQKKKTVALFLGANFDTKELEWSAARSIAASLGIELLRWDWHAQNLPVRGADPAVWPQFGQFPYYNSIPHGRDIMSAVLAACLARKRNIPYIAFGQDRESREKTIRYMEREILRHDVESQKGGRLLQQWLDRNLENMPKLCSPIEGMTIADIRQFMLQKHPGLLAQTQSCFWEQQCCQCVKCISLYVLQRLAEKNIIFFPSNPFANPNNPDLADLINSEIPDNEVGYGAQIRDGIRQIIAEKKYSSKDYWILTARNRWMQIDSDQSYIPQVRNCSLACWTELIEKSAT